MKKISAAGILFCVIVFAVNALAQDVPYKPYNWTGFYVGFQGSYSTGNSEWDPYYSGYRFDHSISGGMGGFFVGYNFHTSSGVVAGIEVEMNYGRVEGSSACPSSSYTCHTDVYWIGSTRGRVGYALNRFLPYFSIGWAYSGADTYVKYLPTGREYGSSNGYFGIAPGVGFELAVTKNILLRAEYSYYYFFKSRVEIDYEDTDIQIDNSAFKVGLSFKF